MPTGHRSIISLVALCSASVPALAADAAESFPNRPVRMIVGFPPGGGTDIMARVISPKLSEAWGQQIAIDNRTGANGTIGATMVARATPDGYTLLMGHLSSNAIAPSLFKVAYDPAKDFTAITLVGSVPHVLVVHPSVPAKSVKELIALIKQQPGKFTFPSAGNGTPPHLAGEIFKMMTGTDMHEKLAALGTDETVTETPEAFRQLLLADIEKYAKIIKAANLRVD